MRAPDFVDDRAILRLAMGEDDVRSIDPHHRAVRRDDDDVEPIELVQFARPHRARCRSCRTGADSRAKKSLQRHRAENAAVRPPLEALLGLERGLQTIGPVAIRRRPGR